MNNRQRIMLKLIGLSDEEFARLLSGTLPDLMGADLPAFCRQRENSGDGALDALAAWLGESAQ